MAPPPPSLMASSALIRSGLFCNNQCTPSCGKSESSSSVVSARMMSRSGRKPSCLYCMRFATNVAAIALSSIAPRACNTPSFSWSLNGSVSQCSRLASTTSICAASRSGRRAPVPGRRATRLPLRGAVEITCTSVMPAARKCAAIRLGRFDGVAHRLGRVDLDQFLIDPPKRLLARGKLVSLAGREGEDDRRRRNQQPDGTHELLAISCRA